MAKGEVVEMAKCEAVDMGRCRRAIDYCIFRYDMESEDRIDERVGCRAARISGFKSSR